MVQIAQNIDPEIVIPERFRGPPSSGNGGYVGGRFAALINSQNGVEVTLRAPVPLDQAMTAIDQQDGSVVVTSGETLVGEVRQAALTLEVPEAPSWDEALAARQSSYSFSQRISPMAAGATGIHPICFCCGADHKDGLRVFAAPVQDGDQVAAVWNTKLAWAGKNGNILPEYLWTALDCPGQFAYLADGVFTGMLGRITAEIYRPAPAGGEYLVTGWRIGTEGKKNFAGTAIFDRTGNLVAAAKSVWIGRRDIDPLISRDAAGT